VIKEFTKNKKRVFPDDTIKLYLEDLIKNNNYWLIKEMKIATNNSFGQPEWFFSENRILSALWNDLSLADENAVWQPFADAAFDELEKEELNPLTSYLIENFRDEKFLWSSRTFLYIKFEYYLVIEGIKRNYESSHFFLHYYWLITDKLIHVLDKTGIIQTEEKTGVELIDRIFDYLLDWLEMSNKENNSWIYHNILDAIGNDIHYIVESKSIEDKFKIKCVNRLLTEYCHLREPSNIEAIRDKFDEILIKPSLLTSTNSYDIILAKAWKQFDKIPHHTYLGDYDYFKRLKDNVIISKGLPV